MAAVSQLGYLGLGVKDVGAWRGYAESLLRLRAVESRKDGDLLLAMDDHHHRFTLHEDDRDDVAYVGWQTESAAEMEAIAARLEAAGVAVSRGSRETAEKRHVAGLIAFDDPDGHAVEVFYGPELVAESAGASESGFVAG
ncbi:MAG: VOC family protein, partial [Anaerolineaceae bacterium]